MNKEQIKAELRRSALEDEYPVYQASLSALLVADDWLTPPDCDLGMFGPNPADSWFLLLVAEAL